MRRIKLFDRVKSYFKNMNWPLMSVTIVLMITGIISVYSATFAYASGKAYFYKQMIWYGIGIAAMAIMANINYNLLINAANYLYVFFILVLITVLVAGHTSLGAQRWIKIAGFQFQPSEFMKIVIALALIRFIMVKHRDAFTWKNIFKMFGLFAVPLFLILRQPDLGTSILLVPVLFAVFFMGNIPVKKLVIIILVGLIALPVGMLFLKGYQKQRIQVFLNPNIDPLGAGYNVIQSQIAVGSGGLAGKGFIQGTQSQLNFIPIKYTDFIYAVISEEFGLIGSLFILFLYLILIMEGLKIVKLCKYVGGKMLGASITTIIFSQVFINIGMNIGIMPVTGITLPLLSYGGTSVLVTMTSIGILQNIYREYMKAEE